MIFKKYLVHFFLSVNASVKPSEAAVETADLLEEIKNLRKVEIKFETKTVNSENSKSSKQYEISPESLPELFLLKINYVIAS